MLLAKLLPISILLILSSTVSSRHRQKRHTPVSLYDKEPLVLSLDANNFDRTVYNSSQATFVEFYAHWCGACRKIKYKIVDLAKRSQRWHNRVIRVAAVNCGDSLNDDLCRTHEIITYPTLRIFAPKTSSDKLGYGMQVNFCCSTYC